MIRNIKFRSILLPLHQVCIYLYPWCTRYSLPGTFGEFSYVFKLTLMHLYVL
ncbi:hypothetical protein NEOC84_001778|nr:hypothetical protein [Neochlamydia sp. AcF84]